MSRTVDDIQAEISSKTQILDALLNAQQSDTFSERIRQEEVRIQEAQQRIARIESERAGLPKAIENTTKSINALQKERDALGNDKLQQLLKLQAKVEKMKAELPPDVVAQILGQQQ